MATTEPTLEQSSDLNNAKLIQLYSDEKKTEKAYPIVNRESIINSDGTNTFDYLENKLNTDIEDFKDEMDNTLGSDITYIRETIKSNKVTNEENKRKIDALLKLGEGITHEFQTDETVKYQKDVPKGAELVSIKKIGGKSIVWNQMNRTNKFDSSGNTDGSYIIDAELDDDGFCTLTKDITSEIYCVSGHIDEPIIAGNIYYVQLYTNNKITIPTNSRVIVRYDEQESGNNMDYNYTKHNLCGYRFKAPANGNILCNSYLQFVPGSGETIVCNDFKWRISTFNLTKMFGVGKEPTQEEFENMLEYEYYEYSKPTIIHNTIFSVQERGKNLINADDYYGEYKQNDGSYLFSRSIAPTIKISLDEFIGKALTLKAYLSADSGLTNVLIALSKDDGTAIRYSNSVTGGSSGYLTMTIDKVSKGLTVRITYEDGSGNINLKDLIVYEGNEAIEYSPYHKNTYGIPQEILNLDNFGWGINDTVYNYIDLETKTYHKTVGCIDLKTVDWKTSTNYKSCCYYDFTSNFPSYTDTGTFTNMISDNNYENTSYADVVNNINNYGIGYNGTNNRIWISVVNGEPSGLLYYELKEEEVIDVSNIIPDNFLEFLSVEEYGSLTFKNNLNMGLQIPVQSTEEYCVKLSDE